MDASAESLEPAVEQAVAPGSEVRTDEWNGYNGLNGLGYVHEIVRKDANVGANLLPHCNRMAALLKRWLLSTIKALLAMSISTIIRMNIHSGSTVGLLATEASFFLPTYSTGCGHRARTLFRYDQTCERDKANETYVPYPLSLSV